MVTRQRRPSKSEAGAVEEPTSSNKTTTTRDQNTTKSNDGEDVAEPGRLEKGVARTFQPRYRRSARKRLRFTSASEDEPPLSARKVSGDDMEASTFGKGRLCLEEKQLPIDTSLGLRSEKSLTSRDNDNAVGHLDSTRSSIEINQPLVDETKVGQTTITENLSAVLLEASGKEMIADVATVKEPAMPALSAEKRYRPPSNRSTPQSALPTPDPPALTRMDIASCEDPREEPQSAMFSSHPLTDNPTLRRLLESDMTRPSPITPSSARQDICDRHTDKITDLGYSVDLKTGISTIHDRQNDLNTPLTGIHHESRLSLSCIATIRFEQHENIRTDKACDDLKCDGDLKSAILGENKTELTGSANSEDKQTPNEAELENISKQDTSMTTGHTTYDPTDSCLSRTDDGQTCCDDYGRVLPRKGETLDCVAEKTKSDDAKDTPNQAQEEQDCITKKTDSNDTSGTAKQTPNAVVKGPCVSKNPSQPIYRTSIDILSPTITPRDTYEMFAAPTCTSNNTNLVFVQSTNNSSGQVDMAVRKLQLDMHLQCQSSGECRPWNNIMPGAAAINLDWRKQFRMSRNNARPSTQQGTKRRVRRKPPTKETGGQAIQHVQIPPRPSSTDSLPDLKPFVSEYLNNQLNRDSLPTDGESRRDMSGTCRGEIMVREDHVDDNVVGSYCNNTFGINLDPSNPIPKESYAQTPNICETTAFAPGYQPNSFVGLGYTGDVGSTGHYFVDYQHPNMDSSMHINHGGHGYMLEGSRSFLANAWGDAPSRQGLHSSPDADIQDALRIITGCHCRLSDVEAAEILTNYTSVILDSEPLKQEFITFCQHLLRQQLLSGNCKHGQGDAWSLVTDFPAGSFPPPAFPQCFQQHAAVYFDGSAMFSIGVTNDLLGNLCLLLPEGHPDQRGLSDCVSVYSTHDIGALRV